MVSVPKLSGFFCGNEYAPRVPAFTLFKILRDGRAEVGGHDSRRRFHGAETEVVTRGRDGEAHQVTVLVDGGHDGGHDQREDVSVLPVTAR